MDLFTNFRPVFAFPELLGASTLSCEAIEGVDLVMLREQTGDIYSGEPLGVHVENGERVGINTMRYSESDVRRVAHAGFTAARGRQKKTVLRGQGQRPRDLCPLTRSGHGGRTRLP
jgi:3-isopropylmalate dehydrogenase